jgi:hypothetical protein
MYQYFGTFVHEHTHVSKQNVMFPSLNTDVAFLLDIEPSKVGEGILSDQNLVD